MGQANRRPTQQGKPAAAKPKRPVQFFELRPQKTIAAAVNASKAHVQAVHKSAGKK